MEQITIKINEAQYIVKQSFRSLLYFEEITQRSANTINDNLTDVLILFYCILKAGNKNTFKYSLDEFYDLLDNNQDSLEIFTNFLTQQAKEQQQPNKKKVMKQV